MRMIRAFIGGVSADLFLLVVRRCRCKTSSVSLGKPFI
jgi:hypothetical protein